MTKATGSLKECIGKPIESTHLGAADPLSRMLALHLYEVRPTHPPTHACLLFICMR